MTNQSRQPALPSFIFASVPQINGIPTPSLSTPPSPARDKPFQPPPTAQCSLIQRAAPFPSATASGKATVVFCGLGIASLGGAHMRLPCPFVAGGRLRTYCLVQRVWFLPVLRTLCLGQLSGFSSNLTNFTLRKLSTGVTMACRDLQRYPPPDVLYMRLRPDLHTELVYSNSGWKQSHLLFRVWRIFPTPRIGRPVSDGKGAPRGRLAEFRRLCAIYSPASPMTGTDSG